MNKNGLINIIIIGIVVLIFAAAGYFALTRKTAEAPVTNQEPETVKENAVLTKGDLTTKDWKTYRNEEYRFEVKYPLGYVPHLVSAVSGAEDNSGTKVVFLKTSEKIGSVPYLVIEYNDNKKSGYLSDPTIKLVESKNITVGGISGTQDKFNGPYGTWTTVYLNKGGIIYSLTSSKDLTNFSQVLSTFKFIE